MGLSGDSAFKPEITAPATQVVSTVSGGKYGNSSGTSFSTPMISGMSALLKEARPEWNHPQIKSALMNTADLMINPVNQLPYPLPSRELDLLVWIKLCKPLPL